MNADVGLYMDVDMYGDIDMDSDMDVDTDMDIVLLMRKCNGVTILVSLPRGWIQEIKSM